MSVFVHDRFLSSLLRGPMWRFLRCAIVLSFAVPTVASAQTHFIVGASGGFGSGYPGQNQTCDTSGRDGAHLGAMAGTQWKRLALFADVSLIVSGGGDDCLVIGDAPNQGGAASSALDVHYPLYPLTLNARLDVFGTQRWSVYVRGGGGIALGTDVPLLVAGIGARLKHGSPAVGTELLLTRFEYQRQGSFAAIDPDAVANPIALRLTLQW